MPEVPEIMRIVKDLKSYGIEVFHKGKLIWWRSANGYIVSHMGMTGFWSEEPTEYTRNSLKSPKGTMLYFNDPRKLGFFKEISCVSLKKMLGRLGPDVGVCTKDDFLDALKKKARMTIGAALLNQKVVSGCGTYLTSDALYLAQIHPKTSITELSDEKLIELFKAIRKVIKKSYESQTFSIATIKRDIKHENKYKFLIYGHKDAIKIKIAGRTIYWQSSI